MPSIPVRGSRNLPPRAAKIKKPARHTRAAAALLASPDTDDAPSDDVEPSSAQQLPVNRKRSSRAASRTARKRMRGTDKASKSRLGSRQLKATVDAAAAAKEQRFTYEGNNLPYHIWLRIFEYIAAPLRDPHTPPSIRQDTRRTLLLLASCDRLFFEPALAALYKCPPIIFHQDFTALVKRLSLPLSEASFNYRPKIEVLRIDIDSFLYRKVNGNYLDLKDLIRPLSRLVEVELYHPYDSPPYRELSLTVKWKYPDDLVDIFKRLSDTESGQTATWTHLTGWKWNARMAGDAFSLDKLAIIHKIPCFSRLRKLAFTNYQLPSAVGRASQSENALELDLQAISHVAAAAQSLPDLEHLVLESSTIASGVLLMMLPKRLKHLELINCFEVTADDFAEFLESHGNKLERLTLNHCQSLSLDFLPVLATACPRLTHLRMNLLYYNHHESYNDSEPAYDTLLSDGQVPTWPATLQCLDIDYMRFAATANARVFFQSLINSAPTLPHLRQLVLKAKLNVGWAERNEFRRTWESRMVDMFLRVSRPPRRFTTDQPKQLPQAAPPRPVIPARAGTRRSARISSPQSSPEELVALNSRGVRESARVAAVTKDLQCLLGRSPQGPGHEADQEDNVDDEQHVRDSSELLTLGMPIPFVHGLCDVVDVQIDNQKPRETQFVMDDFLDSSEESDAEWDSQNE
ncbi:F-box and leucine-rich repeat protein 2/20 [Microdochium nivale]|nr:F-box and leucine-rich repeat protein 2/20 [Microdochium nivale]